MAALSVSSLPSRPASHFLQPRSHCDLRTRRQPALSSLFFPPHSCSSLLTLSFTRRSSTKYSGGSFPAAPRAGQRPATGPAPHPRCPLQTSGPGGLTWELTTPRSPKHGTAPYHCWLSRAEQHRGEEVSPNLAEAPWTFPQMLSATTAEHWRLLGSVQTLSHS